MHRQSALTTLILVLALLPCFALPMGALAADPPGPAIRHQYRVDSLPMAGLAEVVTFVNEYAPGAQTPPHTHPGLTLVTVIEGGVTVRAGGTDKAYQVGDSFTEVPGVEVVATNAGSARARLLAGIVLPKGAAPSTPQPGAPAPAVAPTALYPFRAEAFLPGDAYEVAQALFDFAPGAQTPAHTHPGQTFVTVLDGEITFTTQGATRVYRAGESFVELPEVVGVARNAGPAQATVLATYLLPKGAPLSTTVAAPAMPATGGGGMASREQAGPHALAALVLAGMLLAGVLGSAKHRRRRA